MLNISYLYFSFAFRKYKTLFKTLFLRDITSFIYGRRDFISEF